MLFSIYEGWALKEQPISQACKVNKAAGALFDSCQQPTVSPVRHIVVLRQAVREFPGGPVVRTLCFHCRGHRFEPWLGN